MWSIDISYVETPSGFVYITAIIDWYSRFLVSYSISNTLQADTVTRVVKDPVCKYRAPEIINSDQGSQFTSNEYIELIKSFEKTKISMDGKGRATDNIAIERFFRSYKWERLYLIYPETASEVKTLTNIMCTFVKMQFKKFLVVTPLNFIAIFFIAVPYLSLFYLVILSYYKN